jgi:hypothetical protein
MAGSGHGLAVHPDPDRGGGVTACFHHFSGLVCLNGLSFHNLACINAAPGACEGHRLCYCADHSAVLEHYGMMAKCGNVARAHVNNVVHY